MSKDGDDYGPGGRNKIVNMYHMIAVNMINLQLLQIFSICVSAGIETLSLSSDPNVSVGETVTTVERMTAVFLLCTSTLIQ